MPHHLPHGMHPPWGTQVSPGSRKQVGTPVRSAAVWWESSPCLRSAGRRALLQGPSKSRPKQGEE